MNWDLSGPAFWDVLTCDQNDLKKPKGYSNKSRSLSFN